MKNIKRKELIILIYFLAFLIFFIIFLFLIQKPISNLGKINVLKAEFHDKSSFVVQNILVELT